METHKTCCFIGHRRIELTAELIAALTELIEGLICRENVDTFLFGSKSVFNDLCFYVVTNLKQKYVSIKRVGVPCKSEVCVLESEADQVFIAALNKRGFGVARHDEELHFKAKNFAGKASYVERNREMIDLSDYCIFYFDTKYVPPSKRASIVPYQRKSGTAQAFKYALAKRKRVINIFNKKVQGEPNYI